MKVKTTIPDDVLADLEHLLNTWKQHAKALRPGPQRLALESCAMDLDRLRQSWGSGGGLLKQNPITLASCPPGLFLFNGDFGFKTEYQDQNGPEAYCVGSGEYFWGGTNGDKEARRNLMVMPVIIEVHNEKLTHPAAENK